MSEEQKRDLLGALLLLALLVVFFWPYVFSNPAPLIMPRSSLGTDLVREILPLSHYLSLQLRGDDPSLLWRDYHLSGTTIIGHPVAPLAYPPYWLTLLISVPRALNILAILHLWWAGLAVYTYLRQITQTRFEAALFGGISIALSTRWIALLSGGHWTSIFSIAWLFWSILGFVGYWKTGRKMLAVVSGISLAAQLVTDGRYFIIGILLLGVATLCLIPRFKSTWLRQAAVLWSIALGSGIGLAAVQLLPFIETFFFSTRTSMALSDAASGSLPIPLLLGFLAPQEFQFPEWIIYPGVITILCLGYGWASGWTPQAKGWAVVALCGVVLSLGENLPLYRFLYESNPLIRMLRVPARWIVLSSLATSLLAAWGFESWLERSPLHVKRFRLFALSLGGFYFSAAVLKMAFPQIFPFVVIHVAVIFLIGCVMVSIRPDRYRMGSLVLLLTLDLWISGSSFIKPVDEDDLYREDALLAFIKSNINDEERIFSPFGDISGAALVHHSLESVDGYDSFQFKRYVDFVNLVIGCGYQGYSVTVPGLQSNPAALAACGEIHPNMDFLKLLSVRFLILPTAHETPGLAAVYSGEGKSVYDLDPTGGELQAITTIRQISVENCLVSLSSIDPRKEALVEETEQSGLQFPWRAGWIKLRTPRGRVYETAQEGSGLLIRPETWAPGWRAWVDGEESEVLRVDCALQGVRVPGGSHKIQFAYLPAGFLVGRWVSLVTLVVLCILGGVEARRSMKKPASQ